MKKTDKKRDKAIREVLTEVCESALDRGEGFQWLTHQVDYQRFPQSLVITCVFDTASQLDNPKTRTKLRDDIIHALESIGITLPRPEKQLQWDCEEDCDREHQGDWTVRLSRH